VSADVMFFKSVLYFSPQHLVTNSKTIFLPLSVPLPAPLPAPAPADSSPVPLVDTSESAASKLVQNFRYVYTHLQKVLTSEPAPIDPSPVDSPSPQPSTSLSDIDIPIILRKGNRSCTNHPISKSVSYDHLNSTFHQFTLSVSSENIPRSYEEALLVLA